MYSLRKSIRVDQGFLSRVPRLEIEEQDFNNFARNFAICLLLYEKMTLSSLEVVTMSIRRLKQPASLGVTVYGDQIGFGTTDRSKTREQLCSVEWQRALEEGSALMERFSATVSAVAARFHQSRSLVVEPELL